MPEFDWKENVSPRECDVHRLAIETMPGRLYKNRPMRVGKFDAAARRMEVERLPGGSMTVADMYGEAFESVPPEVITQIRSLVRGMALHGISYPAVTGYHFQIDPASGAVYASDFRHATQVSDAEYTSLGRVVPTSRLDPFVVAFSGGREARWNPRFM